MTAPTTPFAGPTSAAEDLTAFVVDRVGSAAACDAIDEVIAALLAGGQLHVKWGARYHNPDGDVDTWRDTRQEAEATLTARHQGAAPWRHPSSLVRRFVIVTAAEVVT